MMKTMISMGAARNVACYFACGPRQFSALIALLLPIVSYAQTPDSTLNSPHIRGIELKRFAPGFRHSGLNIQGPISSTIRFILIELDQTSISSSCQTCHVHRNRLARDGHDTAQKSTILCQGGLLKSYKSTLLGKRGRKTEDGLGVRSVRGRGGAWGLILTFDICGGSA